MSLPKHTHFYRPIAEAIDYYNERHYLNRSHFARLLGYRGPNAATQLSTALNTTSYNPANPKRLSVDQMSVILDELDEDLRRRALEQIVNHYGYGICANRQDAPKPDVLGLVIGALDAGKHFGDLEATIRDAVADEVIDEGEAADIKAAAFALRSLVKRIEEMVQ